MMSAVPPPLLLLRMRMMRVMMRMMRVMMMIAAPTAAARLVLIRLLNSFSLKGGKGSSVARLWERCRARGAFLMKRIYPLAFQRSHVVPRLVRPCPSVERNRPAVFSTHRRGGRREGELKSPLQDPSLPFEPGPAPGFKRCGTLRWAQTVGQSAQRSSQPLLTALLL